MQPPASHTLVRGLLLVVMVAAAGLFGMLLLHGPVDSGPDPGQGVWGPKTASVNWCEPDYVYTPWVAELGNSLSSFFIVGYGLWGILGHLRLGARLERRYPAAFGMFVVVGVGSFLFHATLLRPMQLLDELPMIWANSIFIYILAQMEQPCELDVPLSPPKMQAQARRRRWLVLGLLLKVVVMSVSVVLFDSEDQNIFLVCYISGLMFIVLRSLALNRAYNVPGLKVSPELQSIRRSVVLMELSNICYFLGLCAWILDRLYCPVVAPLHLHSLWHLCAALGTFLGVLFWLWTRMIVRRLPAVVAGATPLTWRIHVPEKLA